jgi:hypothetical protein
MPELIDRTMRVELDDRWPRITRITRRDGDASLAGCEPDRPFSLILNGVVYPAGELSSTVQSGGTTAAYVVSVPSLALELTVCFELHPERMRIVLADVAEAGAFRLETLYVPDHRLVTGLAAEGDSYYRQLEGYRRNWSREWCPGAGGGGFWDHGPVGDGIPENRCLPTSAACVWNRGICVTLVSSVYTAPLMSALESRGGRLAGRGGRFSVWAGVYAYRLMGAVAPRFELNVGVLGDYNRSGRVDWCDAAAWMADLGVREPYGYHETILYKLYLDDPRLASPLRTFRDCLDVIRMVHEVSGGLRQVVYLVGWQYEGHDTGYPSHTHVNERVGGVAGLRRLMDEARAHNCRVSLHMNLDDSYEGHPEYREDLLSRDPDGRKHLWFFNHENGGRKVYSISHVLSVQSGYERDRLERLLALLPLEQSVHCDAHRMNQTWLPDGRHVSPEAEVVLGMVPIKQMYRERGLDITTEYAGADHHGLYIWGWHLPGWQDPLATVMSHGRVAGFHRAGPEGEALGRSSVVPEKGAVPYEALVRDFYVHWMYAQVLFRKKMVDYRILDWGHGVEAWYEDDTHVSSGRGGHAPRPLETIYEGIPIARGTDRFLPWRPEVIYAFSERGGGQEWVLPETWEGRPVRSALLGRGGESPGPELTIAGRTVRWVAPAGVPVRLSLSGSPATGSSTNTAGGTTSDAPSL